MFLLTEVTDLHCSVGEETPESIELNNETISRNANRRKGKDPYYTIKLVR